VTLKRPVTVAQARRWPAAAKRRESFCARMGGMRDKLTSDRVAMDPRSRINRALAAWDCDEPEGLKREHVTKGIRAVKITPKMVGAEAKKKNPAARRWLVLPRTGRSYIVGSFSTEEIAKRYVQTLNAPWNYKVQREAAPRRIRKPVARAENPAATLYTVHTATGEGKPRDPIAHFRKRADALTYARAYAKSYGVPVVLTGKKT
jgi:hypothetical protein